jgi:O-methyltransferase
MGVLKDLLVKKLESHYWKRHKSAWLSFKTWPRSQDFFDLWASLGEMKPMVSKAEGFLLYRLASDLGKVKGHIAEIGSHEGFTATILARAKGSKELHLFDTWEGFPGQMTGKDKGINRKKYSKGQYVVDFEEVRERLSSFPKVFFHKGVFPETGKAVSKKRFALVHVDVCLHRPTLEAFKFFYPRMPSGGIFVVHDSNFPGVESAIEEFFSKKAELPVRVYDNQTLIVKVGK